MRQALAGVSIVSQIATSHLAVLSVIAKDEHVFSFCMGAIVLTSVAFRKPTYTACLITYRFYFRLTKLLVLALKATCYGIFWSGLILSSLCLLLGSVYDVPGLMIGGFHLLFSSLSLIPVAWTVKHVPGILIQILRFLFMPRYMPAVPARQEQKISDQAKSNVRELDEMKRRHWEGVRKK